MSRWLVLVLVACGPGSRADDGDDDGSGGGRDSGMHDATSTTGDGSTTTSDGSTTTSDGSVVTPDAAPVGVITGGPCMSAAPGATAYRIRWANSGGTAYVIYEVNGLPDKTRDHTGAYGYQIGFTPSYVDPFLAQGGLQLDGSDFVDIELSTVGVSSIANATLAIYGRSYNTTTSGSFNWQTADGYGQTPQNSVSNVAPYAWYKGDMTTEITPSNGGVLLRIKAGPSSGALVVNRIELCMQAS